MLLPNSVLVIDKNANTLVEQLVYLRSIINSANNQLKKVYTPDKILGKLIFEWVTLNNIFLIEIDNEVNKAGCSNNQVSNVVFLIKKHTDIFENSLHLETLIVSCYRTIIDGKTINFSIRKKLQTQLNKMLYACLQIKLLHQNPSVIPYKSLGLLF